MDRRITDEGADVLFPTSPLRRDAAPRLEHVELASSADTHQRRSFISRPVTLLADETVPGTHRSRRFQTAHRPVPPADTRIGVFASTALAVVSLAFVSAVALGSMLASTAMLHLISPSRRIDTFRALHEPLVVGLLFGLAVLWLLPPHPWSVKPEALASTRRRFSRAKAAR